MATRMSPHGPPPSPSIPQRAQRAQRTLRAERLKGRGERRRGGARLVALPEEELLLQRVALLPRRLRARGGAREAAVGDTTGCRKMSMFLLPVLGSRDPNTECHFSWTGSSGGGNGGGGGEGGRACSSADTLPSSTRRVSISSARADRRVSSPLAFCASARSLLSEARSAAMRASAARSRAAVAKAVWFSVCADAADGAAGGQTALQKHLLQKVWGRGMGPDRAPRSSRATAGRSRPRAARCAQRARSTPT